jgi:hypothetical protein
MIDRTGERFGRLVITGKAPGSRKCWWVRCECGTVKTVLYNNLRTTKSCGCWKQEGTYQKDNSGVEFGESTRYFVLDRYKRDAAKRGYAWSLTDKQFYELTSSACHYCGQPPSNIKKNDYNKGDFVYSGIDRRDNVVGYEPCNVVPCCCVCNRSKDVMTEKEFLNWVGRVFKHGTEKAKGDS